MWKVAPLKSSFMLASMLGFMISVVYTAYGRISTDWGFTLGFVFVLMFIASMISMTKAPIDMQIAMAPDFIKQPKKNGSKKRKKSKKTSLKKAVKKKSKKK